MNYAMPTQVGPMPTSELMQEYTEQGMSPDTIYAAWIGGYRDSFHDEEYRTFKQDTGVQPIYDDGYDRGTKDRNIHLELGHEIVSPKSHPQYFEQEVEEPGEFIPTPLQSVGLQIGWFLAAFEQEIRSATMIAGVVYLLRRTIKG